jgi:hypothetical protein
MSHIYAVLSLLNISSPLKQQEFGSSIIFELRRDANNLHYVSVLTKNNSLNQPNILRPVQIGGIFICKNNRILID